MTGEKYLTSLDRTISLVRSFVLVLRFAGD